MESILIASLVFLFSAAMLINWQRHRGDFQGKLFYSPDFVHTCLGNTLVEDRHGVEPYQEAKVVDWDRTHVRVRYPDGEMALMDRRWLLTPEQLPPAIY